MFGFDRAQAEAVVRAIAEAQDELITRKDLKIALAPFKTDLRSSTLWSCFRRFRAVTSFQINELQAY